MSPTALFQYPAVCSILLLLSACAGESPGERQQRLLISRLDSSQQAMIAFTEQQTHSVMFSLEEKTKDPFSIEKMTIWKPHVDTIWEATKLMCDYLRRELHSFSAPAGTGKNDVRQMANELYTRLYEFKRTVLNTDMTLRQEFEQVVIPFININMPMNTADAARFAQSYFFHLNVHEITVQLHYWLMQVTVAQNKMLTYCNHRATVMFCGMDVSRAFIGQNSSVLSPGGQLEILAGVGSFTSKATPKFFVSGKPVQKGYDPYFIYKLKVPVQPGQYVLPLRMEYLNQNGIETTENITVSYTVRK